MNENEMISLLRPLYKFRFEKWLQMPKQLWFSNYQASVMLVATSLSINGNYEIDSSSHECVQYTCNAILVCGENIPRNIHKAIYRQCNDDDDDDDDNEWLNVYSIKFSSNH